MADQPQPPKPAAAPAPTSSSSSSSAAAAAESGPASDAPAAPAPLFDWARHTKYFKRCLQMLPHQMQSLDVNRMTVVFFALSGLDLLGALDGDDRTRREVADWICAQQVPADVAAADKDAAAARAGFRGGPYLGEPAAAPGDGDACGRLHPYDGGHLAMTYTALATLAIVGDDFSRVRRQAIAEGLRHYQLDNGCFRSTWQSGESDMRFLYCACSIAAMLDDWRGVDKAAATAYIRSSQGYDAAFGQGPELESHGGSTFCALASLHLMGTMDEVFDTEERREGIRAWLVNRQQTGFQGRPHKPADTCYSFWVGASLRLVGIDDLVSCEHNRAFLGTTQHPQMAGFAKWPDHLPDPLHSYMGICGLALQGEPGLQPLDAALNMSQRAANHLAELHKTWRQEK